MAIQIVNRIEHIGFERRNRGSLIQIRRLNIGFSSRACDEEVGTAPVYQPGVHLHR